MRLFADSFYFIALLHETDSHHEHVRRFSSERRDVLVTTKWVLAEVADALCAPALRGRVTVLLEQVMHHPSVVVLGDSDELFDRGAVLYHARPDKHWSLTDCISFVVMEQEGLREALTGDRHFEQAGFVALFA